MALQWIPILGDLIGWGKEYTAKKQQLKITKLEAEQKLIMAQAEAQAHRLLDQQDHVQSWEIESIRAAGWRDDGVTVVVLAILMCCFVPYTQPYVIEGFNSLGELPIWFQIIVGIVLTAPFGVRVFNTYEKLVGKK